MCVETACDWDNFGVHHPVHPTGGSSVLASYQSLGSSSNSDAQYSDTQYSDTQYSDTQYSDTQNSDTQYSDPQCSDTLKYTLPVAIAICCKSVSFVAFPLFPVGIVNHFLQYG